jgi:hypothetical protein
MRIFIAGLLCSCDEVVYVRVDSIETFCVQCDNSNGADRSAIRAQTWKHDHAFFSWNLTSSSTGEPSGRLATPKRRREETVNRPTFLSRPRYRLCEVFDIYRQYLFAFDPHNVVHTLGGFELADRDEFVARAEDSDPATTVNGANNLEFRVRPRHVLIDRKKLLAFKKQDFAITNAVNIS